MLELAESMAEERKTDLIRASIAAWNGFNTDKKGLNEFIEKALEDK